MTYKLTQSNQSIQRVSDGACIPKDPDNSDYMTYLDWVEAGNTPEPAFSEEELAQAAQKTIASNIDTLWQAAHNYEYSFINGMAIGLLTLGVLQQLPKSLAIKDWSKAIWALYYERKAQVTSELAPSLNDFSIVGAMPHTVPELMVELGY